MADRKQAAAVHYDADAVLAELDEIEDHLTGDSVPLAKAAFQRVFESVTLYWEQVSPRRRNLSHAAIVPRFPFCLTESTSSGTPGDEPDPRWGCSFGLGLG